MNEEFVKDVGQIELENPEEPRPRKESELIEDDDENEVEDESDVEENSTEKA